MFDHLPVTPAAGKFVFRQMGDDFDHRPFSRRRTPPERLFRNALNQVGKSAWRLALKLQNILAGDISSQPRAIFFRRFLLSRHHLPGMISKSFPPPESAIYRR